MNYQKIYDSIIERARNRIIEVSIYTESHHVIPKCIGGNNISDNLVNLTPEEHYIAHQLLVKIYPNENKLAYACRMMTLGNKNHSRNNKMYGWLRRRFSKAMSQLHTGKQVSDETKNKMREAAKLRTPVVGWKHTDETKKKMSLNHKRTKTRLGAVLSEETKNKIRIGNLNREPVSEEFRAKMSERTKGELNPMYGRKHSEETKEHIRLKKLGFKHSEESRTKMSISKLGSCRGKYIESTCPHCGKTGSGGNMKRYHFDNCKENKN